MSLPELLESILKLFHFLFEKYNFAIVYTFERPYPTHIRVGLVSEKVPYIKILFVHEWATSVSVGSKSANFDEEAGWFDIRDIMDFLLHRHRRWFPEKINIPYKKFLIMNLEEYAREFSLSCEIIFELFRDEESIKQWQVDFQNYLRDELRYRFHRINLI